MTTTATVTKLPVVRWIEDTEIPSRVVVDEEYAQEIQDAINQGIQIAVDTVMTGYIFADARKETCLTRFVDPRVAEVRWAVEVWNGTERMVRDFRTIDGARDFREHQNDRLGI